MKRGLYDGTLQMFVAERPAEVDLRWLAFLRWLAQRGKFGPDPIWLPSGPYADLLPKHIRSKRRPRPAATAA